MSIILAFYSNRSRGLRKKALGKSLTDKITTESPPPKKVCRKKWAPTHPKDIRNHPFAAQNVSMK